MRPPGVYKQDYLNELFKRYGDAEDTPAAPILPDWCTGDLVTLSMILFNVLSHSDLQLLHPPGCAEDVKLFTPTLKLMKTGSRHIVFI